MGKQSRFLDRRSFLKRLSALIGTAVLLARPDILLAQTADVQAVRLSDKVLLVQGPDSNVLVVDSTEGLIMVDGIHRHRGVPVTAVDDAGLAAGLVLKLHYVSECLA